MPTTSLRKLLPKLLLSIQNRMGCCLSSRTIERSSVHTVATDYCSIGGNSITEVDLENGAIPYDNVDELLFLFYGRRMY